jgi:hypothetical protein
MPLSLPLVMDSVDGVLCFKFNFSSVLGKSNTGKEYDAMIVAIFS